LCSICRTGGESEHPMTLERVLAEKIDAAIDAFDAVLQESLTEFLSDPAHLMTASELAQFLAKFERYRSGKLDVIVAELRRADNRLS
jgi:hypothetical protein